MPNESSPADITLSYEDLRTLIQRAYATLYAGEEWPTNEELGGHALLGTRDDEFKWEAQEYAEEIIAAYLKGRKVSR